MASNQASWKLFGVPLSQPFRSVAWVLLQHKIPFECILTVPGTTTKIGSRSPDYLKKSRTGRVPLLEDPDGFVVAESPAILSHLCERFGTSSSWYGLPGSHKKATIDSYMHWHHHGTRNLARVAFPYLRPEDANKFTNNADQDRKKAMQALRDLEDGWFTDEDAPYLAGFSEPSIADLLAYEEVVQLTGLGLLVPSLMHQEYPRLYEWTQRMSNLPFHEQVHVSLYTLGDVTKSTNGDIPFAKRLGAATKAGLKALVEAQSDYVESGPLQSKL